MNGVDMREEYVKLVEGEVVRRNELISMKDWVKELPWKADGAGPEGCKEVRIVGGAGSGRPTICMKTIDIVLKKAFEISEKKLESMIGLMLCVASIPPYVTGRIEYMIKDVHVFNHMEWGN